jgi:integrase
VVRYWAQRHRHGELTGIRRAGSGRQLSQPTSAGRGSFRAGAGNGRIRCRTDASAGDSRRRRIARRIPRNPQHRFPGHAGLRLGRGPSGGPRLGPGEIPAGTDVARLGQALARGRRRDLHELIASTAAYNGLRLGELFALTTGQVDQAARVITVDRKLIEVAGQLYVEAPKCRKHRSTIYPVCTPEGYPLAAKLTARIGQARAEQETGANPLGLIFPSPRGSHWRSPNFDRRVLPPAYLAAGWRDADGQGSWTWHSLRHVFCTTAQMSGVASAASFPGRRDDGAVRA